MAPIPPDKTDQTNWQINRRRAGDWRSWNGEVVVYDDLSGDTMKLDVILAEAFQFLLLAPATQDELASHLASVFALDADGQLRHLAATIFQKFEGSGLIEPAGDGGPPVPAG